jgi:hypothetical protein
MHEASRSPGVPVSAQRIDGHKLQWSTTQDFCVVDEPGQHREAALAQMQCNRFADAAGRAGDND